MSNTQKWQIRQALPSEVEYLSELAFRSKSYWGYSDCFMQACLAELTVDRTNRKKLLRDDVRF